MKISNSYLEDEVRQGFFVPSIMKRAWVAEMSVLSEVDKVCKRHGISWFAEWGTLLGAVRHHGFVPWDDDIDILMLRKDYEHFLQVCHELPDGYKVLNCRNHPDFWHFLARVVAKPRICFEEQHLEKFNGFPYIAGIDIFVGDYIAEDPEKEKLRTTTAQYVISVAEAIGTPQMLGHNLKEHVLRIGELFSLEINYNQEERNLKAYLYQMVEKLLSRFNEEESLLITQMPYTLSGEEQHWMPKEWYAESIEMPFEYMSVSLPVGYDQVLSRKWGDYMCPVRSRGGHEYPFFHTQRKELEGVLDFKIPGFYFSKEKAERQRNITTGSLKEKSLAAYKEINDLLLQVKQGIADGNYTVVQEKLVQAQEISIDLGTMIDKTKSEDLETVRFLEQFCEVLYQVHNAFEIGMRKGYEEAKIEALEKSLSKVKDSLIKEIIDRKEVVFLSYKAQYWNVMENLYKKVKEKGDCDIYVISVPYYDKNYLGDFLQVHDESKLLAERVAVTAYDSFDFVLHHPDCIVIQNPYDEYNLATSVDKYCYSKNLQRFTENLVYIPYFIVDEFSKLVEIQNPEEIADEEGNAVEPQEEEVDNEDSAYKMMQYYCNMPGVINADKILVQSENMRQLYIEKLTEFSGEENRAIWEKKIYDNMDIMLKGII